MCLVSNGEQGAGKKGKLPGLHLCPLGATSPGKTCPGPPDRDPPAARVGACLKLRADLCLRKDVRASGGFRRLPRPPLTARRAGRAGLQWSDSDRCHHVLKVPREVENATACSSASAVPCPSDLRAAVADSRRLEMHARQRPGERARGARTTLGTENEQNVYSVGDVSRRRGVRPLEPRLCSTPGVWS